MNPNEKYIKEVIKRYGTVINLKETPYVLIEIIRNFGRVFDDIPDGGLPCGGVPNPPPPPTGPEKRVIRQMDLVQQIQLLNFLITQVNVKVDKLVAQNFVAKAKPEARSKKASRKK